jgi:hypothetical protein
MRARGGHRKASWLISLAVVAVAGVLSFVLVWSFDSTRPASARLEENPSNINDIVASRFPTEWEGSAPLTPAAFALANVPKVEILANASALDWLASPLFFDQAHLSLASLPPYSGTELRPPEGTEVRTPPPRPERKVKLFTEAQIASLKERLKLTADQEEMWPTVEAALRAIAWRGSPETLNHKTATLDPRSLIKITLVLGPFLKTLRADQKSELRSIAHVMGLEQLASQL